MMIDGAVVNVRVQKRSAKQRRTPYGERGTLARYIVWLEGGGITIDTTRTATGQTLPDAFEALEKRIGATDDG